MPPEYEKYIRFSGHMRKIYEEFTDRVESFGLDECWMDISNPRVNLSDGEKLADKLRHRITDELGITVSVGVSFNKIFAKLGSDMKKPDATTVISRESFQQQVWPLPVSDLLFVGPHTTKKLANWNINTIGQLANYPTENIQQKLGKNGLILQDFAKGLDSSPVMPVEARAAIKSVGNSTTLPRDVETISEASAVIYLLSESVAARLREHGFRSGCIAISVRDTKLNCPSCQRTIDYTTALAGDIARTAISLFRERYTQMLPLRSMGVHCSSLVPDDSPIQLDLLGKALHREKELTLAKTIDDIRRRFGQMSIQRGIVLAEKPFADINPKDDHTIHPVPFYTGK
jgi:DNA polymerase-4